MSEVAVGGTFLFFFCSFFHENLEHICFQIGVAFEFFFTYEGKPELDSNL